MASVSRLYLDTNVFIAMAEGSDELSSQLYALVGEHTQSEPFFCTSELSLAELIVQPYRDKNDRLIQLYDDWINPSAWLEVRQVDRGVLWYAAVIRRHYGKIKLPDAIHLSTAIGMGCSHFMTGDKRIPDQVTITNERWGQVSGAASVSTLRLTVDAVAEIRLVHQ